LHDATTRARFTRDQVRKAPLFAVVVLGVAALLRPAFAYTDSGDRIFPANIQLPQIAPGDEFYLNYTTLPLNPGASGGQTRATDVTATYGKTITDSLGVFIEMTYTGINQAGASTLYGWQNVDGELKYEAINDPTHEFLFSLGLDRETGGTGAERVGAFASGATTPRAYFGKGFGDLDIGFLRPLAIEGMFGSAFADAAPPARSRDYRLRRRIFDPLHAIQGAELRPAGLGQRHDPDNRNRVDGARRQQLRHATDGAGRARHHLCRRGVGARGRSAGAVQPGDREGNWRHRATPYRARLFVLRHRRQTAVFGAMTAC
jgi:hypothetical protein